MHQAMFSCKDSKLASRYAIFVDDIPQMGCDQNGDEHTKHACKELKSRMNSRGNWADDRKCRDPLPTLGLGTDE